MWYERDINAPQPDARLYIDKPRPFPKYPQILYVDNGARHDYRAFTLEAERRLNDGLFVQVAYTAARDRGNTTEWFNPIENPFDLDRDMGRDQATPRHRVTSMVMYDLPFGRDRKWLSGAPRAVDLALGGWQVSAVAYQQTGVFLTPTVSVPDPTGTRFTAGANRPVVTIRPDQLSDPALSDPTIDAWFNRFAFGAPPIGRFGTGERGAIEGPGLNVWHLGVNKTFKVGDAANAPRVRIEATTTNLFNTPQWGNPNTNVTSTNATAATIRTTGGPTTLQQAGARTMRLGLRVEW
jgi:hypothetical protein